MIVEVADLGRWGAASLVAEYDPADDTIRIDGRCVATIRAALGDAEAERFMTVAIAHETYHRDRPRATEGEVRAHVAARFGDDPARYEALLRAAKRARA